MGVADQIQQPFERTRHYFRTDEIGSRLPPAETWETLKTLLDLDDRYDEAMQVEVGDNVFRNHPRGRNPGDLIQVPVAPSQTDHFAVMPHRLAGQLLKATLPTGGICLDPFMGSGTTGTITLELGGKFIGIELNEAYVKTYAKGLASGASKRTVQEPAVADGYRRRPGGGPAAVEVPQTQ